MNERIEAAERMAAFASEGRLIQGGWHEARNGRELACLLGAIGPDVFKAGDCPAEVMPAWLAHLLPVLFDAVQADQATNFGLQFACALRAKPVDDAVRDRWLARVFEFAPKAEAYAREAWEAAAEAAVAYAAHAAAEAAAEAAEAAEAYAAAYTADAAVAAWAARKAAYEKMFNWLIEEMEE